MKMDMKFYKCDVCGNIIAKVYDSGVTPQCCGKDMKEIKPNTTDGDMEKHVPVVAVKDNMVIVKVGAEEHPMTKDHYIQWIAIETSTGNQRKCLSPDDKPEACFALCEGDDVLAVYEYCNIHGLWKAEM